MDSQIVNAIVSSRTQVEEGQLLKLKGPQLAGDYYQLDANPGAPLMLVLQHSFQNDMLTALVPVQPEVHPGTQVQFRPRQPEPGVIQGPVVHAILTGENGCALQIANFGEIPPHFASRRFDIEVERLQSSVRLPVLKQSFQYSFSGNELLTVVLGHGPIADDFPVGSWARFHSV